MRVKNISDNYVALKGKVVIAPGKSKELKKDLFSKDELKSLLSSGLLEKVKKRKKKTVTETEI